MERKLRILPLLLALLLSLSLVSCSFPTADQLKDAADAVSEIAAEVEVKVAEVQNDHGYFNFGGDDTPEEEESSRPPEDGSYTSKEDLALYLHTYGHLPSNFITKAEARDLGWPGGSLEEYAPGKCIGGDRFGNMEGLLPRAKGRQYYECDVDTLGANSRGAKRIVWSNDGLIYYTEDHYESFTLLYGEE